MVDSAGLQRLTIQIQEEKDMSREFVKENDPCAEVSAVESPPREDWLRDSMGITGSLNSRALFQVSLALGAMEKNSLIPSISF